MLCFLIEEAMPAIMENREGIIKTIKVAHHLSTQNFVFCSTIKKKLDNFFLK